MSSKEEIAKLLKRYIKHDVQIETPSNPEFGDYAVPCFSLAKVFKKNPVEIAKELAEKIPASDLVNKVEAKGPYLNIFTNKEDLTKDVLKKIVKEKDKYGSSNTGKGKKILIEHTSINPNASPHVGRARNALIGDSITRILKFQNYKVETHYFVNDIGKQIAMLALGAGKKKVKFNDLLKIYININKKVEKNPELEKKVFGLLQKLENHDKQTVKSFRDIVNVCIKGQTEIFSKLDIKYDVFDYESDYLWKKETKDVLEKLKKTKKLFEDEQGRLVLDQKGFDLAMKSPVLVLTRADKTSLYPLRDMAYTIDKEKKGFDKNILVLGEDQKLYFQQLKAGLSLLKHKAPDVIYYSFVLLTEGKMSTRKGTLVLLEDFMEEAVQKAKKEIQTRAKLAKKELEKRAETIGYGSIKYSILKVGPEKNVTFDWKHALAFEGDTGPYLQYAYARICSILRKYGKKLEHNTDLSLLGEVSEVNLIKKLEEFTLVVKDAELQLKPHLIASYLYSLSKTLNEFYHSCNVLKEEEKLKKARLLLIDCVKQVLENGLSLLGINVLERM